MSELDGLAEEDEDEEVEEDDEFIRSPDEFDDEDEEEIPSLLTFEPFAVSVLLVVVLAGFGLRR